MRRKSAYLNLRIHPDLKEALRSIAAAERRSLSGMVEEMILARCRDTGFGLPDAPRDPVGRHARKHDRTGKRGRK